MMTRIISRVRCPSWLYFLSRWAWEREGYFAEISAEELYYILTDKYNLTNGDEILINKGEFQNINDTLSKAYREFISYAAEYKIAQTFESINVKFVKGSNAIKDSKIVYNKECTIPFAA